MYWTPKMQKELIHVRFIVVSKKCITKLISTAVSIAYKLIFQQIKSFYDKSHFYPSLKEFCDIENSKLILENMEQICGQANAKAISTFDFFTLYTNLPHFDLINVLNNLIDFAIKGGNKKYIGFSINAVIFVS